MKKSIKIDDDYYPNTQKIENEIKINAVSSTNHIFVVDVSGSMYYDLPLIRK
ncbi:MAG: hypothetical protein U9Q27_02030 [Patescibacteria group bacterium]|nr:hypothetical protein [Patescibacteria group bacterium]